MLKLLRFLSSASFPMVMTIALAGVLSGVCSAVLIALINESLYATGAQNRLLVLGIAALALGKVVTGAASKWLLLKFAQQTLLDLSIKLCRRVLAAPFRQLEQTGWHRVLTALTSDVPVLGAALQAIPSLTINVAVIAGCGAYLAWLYPLGFLGLVVVVGVGAAIYRGLQSSAFLAILGAREQRDRLMRAFRLLTDGIKELKMNELRGREFLEHDVERTAEELKRHNLTAQRKYMYVDAWSQILFYITLAGALLLFPRDAANSTAVLTGYVFAALYVMTPVWTLIGTLPTFANGLASLKKLDELGVTLTASPDVRVAPKHGPLGRGELELSNVRFSYSRAAEDFGLGPVNLRLRPGEIAFLVGGNGSGKTTLVKLLAGLYLPDGGEIRLDGTRITETNVEWYRQHVSAVFFDFCLFESLLGVQQPNADALANGYLEQLELAHKVSVTNKVFSTTRLSQGQRKRLALLSALMEERPICIFDEWAADQDPHYKQIFYSTILPMLKERGRTVIVVTHDDRFFDRGDRVIKLEDGTIVPAPIEARATASLG